MTNYELDAFIAQKVRGFKGEPEGGPVWWVSRNERGDVLESCCVSEWEPTYNVAQALEALLETGLDFQISRKRVVVLPVSDLWTSFELFHEGTPESIAWAICQSLLMQIREKGDL